MAFPRIPLVVALAVMACNGDDTDTGDPSDVLANTLFVGLEGSLVSYDIATGQERPGAVQDVTNPVDLQALDDGHLMVNLTGRNEILVVDGHTMLEVTRIPSSGATGTRPVHSYLTPERDGRQLWMTLNDGADTAATNSALFVDVSEGSADRFEAVGEVALGIGHHKAAFSTTKDRVVISNISDCGNVMSVYDYTDLAAITTLATLTAEEAGWDGSTFAKTCDPTYQTGLPPAPHGCTTSTVSGRAYCSVTTSGEIVAVDLDADPPTFTRIPTGGSGGGYTYRHPAGRYVYSLQESPREGDGGVACQIGQVAVLDTTTDTIVDEVPVLYDGPACTRSLLGTDEETANPGHAVMHHDVDDLFITLAGGFGVTDARVRRQVVFDATDPAHPVQRPSFETGAGTSHRGDACDGTGSFLFVANNADGTVTQHDIEAGTTTSIATGGTPLVLATFGDVEGPSHQTGPLDEE